MRAFIVGVLIIKLRVCLGVCVGLCVYVWPVLTCLYKRVFTFHSCTCVVCVCACVFVYVVHVQ